MDRIVYEDSRSRLSHASRTLGIISLVTVIIIPPMAVFAIMMACLALLLCYLSKGPRKTLDKNGKFALVTGLVALCISITMLTTTMYKFMNDADYRHEVLSTVSEMYGDVYTEEEFNSIYNSLLGENDANIH